MTYVAKIDGPGCGCEAHDHKRSLISLDQAFAAIGVALEAVRETEVLPLGAAKGRILAEPVLARSMTPPFDNAAMDGYAVRSAELSGEGPWTLQVAGRITAGTLLRDGEQLALRAVRIFTGAPVPQGFDTVVMQEEVQREGDQIVLDRKPRVGSHIRRTGEDMAQGAVVLAPGASLGPREIAACAAAGHGEVTVKRKIRVAFLSSGDELADAGAERDPAQIWDINLPMICAALPAYAELISATAGGADDPETLKQHLSKQLAEADLVITTGGISVGEADFVKPVMRALGVEEVFSGVALKPGKPITLGRRGARYWLGLPGNPLSAYITWHLFGRDVLARLSGFDQPATRRHVVLTQELRHRPGRCELRLARLAGFDGQGRELVAQDAATHSGRVAGLPKADGAVLVPGDCETIAAGGLVEFVPFFQD